MIGFLKGKTDFDLNEKRATTRNIRKLGDVANLSLCTFTNNHNGLIGFSFEIPANAYCHPLPVI